MSASMRIAVASGKGGTGKTTTATSLALSLARDSSHAGFVSFLDCDVEEPNACLYLHPTLTVGRDAVIFVPAINPARCTACGRCVEVCQFHALALIGKKVMVFRQLCHGCESCANNCPEKAITENANPIGRLEAGFTETGIGFAHGVLTVSEPMPTPIIRQLKRWKWNPDYSEGDRITILDAPPGASCAVVETVRGCDFVVLVTEPTPFGLHDLKQMTGILQEMNISAGVVINRDGIGDGGVAAYCAEQGLPILMRIPFERAIAAGLSAGVPLVDIQPDYHDRFLQMVQQIHALTAEKLR